ncbi:TetR family transcriptional regulator [Wenzhouxiangella sp. AB-CW3]|uniref:TetR family transcriptional regulator n=1 Tax=Wenzhouxiangella sp. AB-CW3 TaxID=2771012 RepID=UPI00168C018A|nr:TetR family transcriptional regulator [Wenzhouxiangella sp. AB-CW3]QOC23734.1 TetR family transcriptional regulator [Wenzhouxiangella sp. AB-CW3]
MPRRTREEAEATREALLDAAEQVFHEKGVARASLQEIARTAGVTRGAFYWHFRDKAELFRAMLERVNLPFEELVEAIPPGSQPQGELERIRLASLVALERMQQPRFRRIHGILIHRCEIFDDIDPVAMMREMAATSHATTLEHFRRAEAAMELKPGLDGETANQLFHCTVRGLVHNWHLDTNAFSLHETGSALLNSWFSLIERQS